MPEQNVIVVGGGPIGLITALGLARSGVHVTVLEASAAVETGPYDMVYHWVTLPALQRLGVLQDASTEGFTEQELCIRRLSSGQEVVFDLAVLDDELEHPFNLHLTQRSMTAVLLAHLARHPLAEVRPGTVVGGVEQDGDGVTVLVENSSEASTFRAGYVIGADGSRSIVRRELGLGLVGMTWPDRFVATDVDADLSVLGSGRTTYQVDRQHGALIAQIERGGPWRYTYAERRTLPEESIEARMGAEFAAALPAGTEPGVRQWASYRIHQRCAEQFRVGRVALVGDAAHLTNPVSSYGLATGILDAVVLTEALVAVLADQADEAVLDRYSVIRRKIFREYASPYSAEAKRMIFDFDSETAAATLARLQRTAGDRDLARDYLLRARNLAGPSALTLLPL